MLRFQRFYIYYSRRARTVYKKINIFYSSNGDARDSTIIEGGDNTRKFNANAANRAMLFVGE